MMIIVGCSNSKKLDKKIGEKLNFPYQDLSLEDFPDGEMHLKFKDKIKNKTVVLVQSFYPHPNHSLIEVLFASSSAKDLGANKVILIAPYLAYLREDERISPGECISSKVIGEILSKNFDAIITVEPHIHRHNLNKIFSIPVYKVNISELLKDYIKKNFKDVLIFGIDEGSGELVKKLHFNSIVLNKKRKNYFNVSIKGKIPNFSKEKEVLIVDDIISTGSTMIEAIKFLKSRKVNCFAVHPVFVGGALRELEKYADKIVSSNTIYNETNDLDVSNLIAKKLMEI